MKQLLLFFVIISFSFLVHSSVQKNPYPEFSSEVNGFKPGQFLGILADPDNTLSKQKNETRNFLRDLDKSVIQLHHGCSAVLVSNTGHAVTALHCFNKLLKGMKSPLERKILFKSDNGTPISSNQSNPEMEGHIYNNWMFNADRYPDRKELVPIKLITFGEGFPDIIKGWKHSDQSTIQNSQLIRRYIDDYAIIKLNKMPDQHKCVKTAESMPISGSLTWTVGYPAGVRDKQIYLTLRTLKELKFKSDTFNTGLSSLINQLIGKMSQLKTEFWYPFEAKQQASPFYVAVGRAFKDYNELKKTFKYPIKDESDKLFDLITDPEKYLVSTSFVKPGFSGGGIFNKKFELVGINSMKPLTPVFLDDSLQPLISHVRMDYIKAQIKNRLEPSEFKQIFDCN